MIPFIDLQREYAEIGTELDQAYHRVMESGVFIQGPQNERFGKEFASWIGCRYAAGMNSGSDALYLALRALGIHAGDEVITVAHTFISTADAVIRTGARPVFVDIDKDTMCMDVSRVGDCVTRNTRAILPVHLYGHPVDMGPLSDIARDHDLRLVEDACQAHGALYKGKKAGSLGDIGCFSFYPVKNLGCFGDGGMIVTNDKDIAQNIRTLGNYGQREKYHSGSVGINSRLDEIQAAFLRVKLKHLDQWNNRRRRIAETYGTLLRKDHLVLPVERTGCNPAHHLYVVRSPERDRLQDRLKKTVQTLVHYPVPVHLQQSYKPFGLSADLPVTEKICHEILSLPLHPWLDDNEVEMIAREVNHAAG
jgi:dTDP-4-amino-4,6-dideoxygalactose transaminase